MASVSPLLVAGRTWHVAETLHRRATGYQPRANSLLHFLQDIVSPAFGDQLIVLAGLAESQVGEEQHQEHHSDNRNIVRCEHDAEKLIQRASFVHLRVTPLSRTPTNRVRLCQRACLRSRLA